MNKGVSLREKKHVRTKLSIMRECIEQLRVRRFEDIAIADVCHTVEVSEGTFYNYFPQKIEVLRYFLALELLQWQWEVAQKMAGKSVFLQLVQFYTLVGSRIKTPHLIYELVGALVREKHRDIDVALSVFEKETAFPECEGIGHFSLCSSERYFKEKVCAAQKNGEFPKKIKSDDAALILHSIMCGVPLVLPENDFGALARCLTSHFEVVWKGWGGL